MRSENEIRCIIAKEKEKLTQIKNRQDYKCALSFIAGLECVLDE